LALRAAAVWRRESVRSISGAGRVGSDSRQGGAASPQCQSHLPVPADANGRSVRNLKPRGATMICLTRPLFAASILVLIAAASALGQTAPPTGGARHALIVCGLAG